MDRCAAATVATGNLQQYSGVIIVDSREKSTISFPMAAEGRTGIAQGNRNFSRKGRDFHVHWQKRAIREEGLSVNSTVLSILKHKLFLHDSR
jgi:hypothetical protein